MYAKSQICKSLVFKLLPLGEQRKYIDDSMIDHDKLSCLKYVTRVSKCDS